MKDKDEATARAVGGVTEVRNLLQVVKESRQEQSVDNGLVFRDGSTASLANKLRAIDAYGTPGVRQVASDIETEEK